MIYDIYDMLYFSILKTFSDLQFPFRTSEKKWQYSEFGFSIHKHDIYDMLYFSIFQTFNDLQFLFRTSEKKWQYSEFWVFYTQTWGK